MYGSFGRRSLQLGAQRLLPSGRSFQAAAKSHLLTPAAQAQNTALRVLGCAQSQYLRSFASPAWCETTPVSAIKPLVPAAAPAQAPLQAASQPAVEAQASAMESFESAAGQARKNGLVFEIGITYTFLHYQSIFIALMRCTFQAFRPLLILFVFGQIFKAVFFIAGAPIWCSFYSIWLFEVGYGLAQCIISFIFISFFYNNLSFARIRPTVAQYLRQQRQRLAQAARALA
mmetsp:Transcript_13498/g.30659  ORF Transcript_13498/g.30659 Transcript_13498/m.30659 type:complete len:230 (-) Transcript_13498:115-804(-)